MCRMNVKSILFSSGIYGMLRSELLVASFNLNKIESNVGSICAQVADLVYTK